MQLKWWLLLKINLFNFSDSKGKIVVWDVTSMSDVSKDATIRELSTPPKHVVKSVALNLRQLFVGTNKNAKILDFWSTPSVTSCDVVASSI